MLELVESFAKPHWFAFQPAEGTEQGRASPGSGLGAGRTVTQRGYGKVAALEQVHQYPIAHTQSICHLQGFVISPSMDQWNYKLIMHSQAWIIAHIKTTYEVF